MQAVADGSDYMGSLRNPAAFNNVLGFRPAYVRVPSEAKDVFLPSWSVKGPMARTCQIWPCCCQSKLDTIRGCRSPFARIRNYSRTHSNATSREFASRGLGTSRATYLSTQA